MATTDELVLSEHGVFLTTDPAGAVPPGRPGTLGLIASDTRFLSGYALSFDGERPALLSVEDRGFAATLTYDARGGQVRGSDAPARLLLRRRRYISAPPGGEEPPALREHLTLTSYEREPLEVELRLALRADFWDIFKVRGFAGLPPGDYLPNARPGPGLLVLGYRGRDGVGRRMVCRFAPAPAELTDVPEAGACGAEARFVLRLEPRLPAVLELAFQLCVDEPGAAAGLPAAPEPFEAGLARLREDHRRWREQDCTGVSTDSPPLEAVLAESLRSLRLLLLEEPTGPYPAAGIPWFAVPFGRDGLLTALSTLAINPRLAVGTLRFLAAQQGRDEDPRRDEQPGKIMHELRVGEAVRSGVSPFGPYYGTVDATPLFLVLLGRALPWLGDDGLARELLAAARAALGWLDGPSDPDGDGYIEFARKAGGGLANQGWKDSGDSLQFPDGGYAAAPIALVEVQGYAYEARLAGAALLERVGDLAGAAAQRGKAAALRRQFNRDFWLEGEQFLAQALDAQKRPVPAVTSNAGHCLWSGIVEEEKAAAVARRLVAPDMCSGWGVRTLSSGYPSYNPLSYHNGSVWPHDTALVVAGLARCGFRREAGEVFAQVVAAGFGYPEARLPELYGGLPREEGERRPVPYPVSCSPQAWSAASAFLMLQAVLGLEADAERGELRLRPLLPAGLSRVRLERLRVGGRVVALAVAVDPGGRARATLSADGEEITREATAGEALVLPLAREPVANA